MTNTTRLLLGLSCAALVASAAGLYRTSRPVLAQTSPKAHWEPYREQHPTPSVDQGLTDPALTGAIDLHAHYGPDAYERQWDAFEVVALAKARGMRGVVLKNHWTESAGLVQLIRKYGEQGIEVFGSVTLDTPVGGVNPMAVRYMADVEGTWGRIVWMPTHDSEHEVRTLGQDRPFVRVSMNGELLPEVLEVIELIAEHGLTLATGHVTSDEALSILRVARARGVERMIVTHPGLGPQYTNMSLDELREAVDLGGYIEITASMLIGDDEGRERGLEILREIGPTHCFIASDSGLTGSPNHPDALVMAARVARNAGFSEPDLDLLFKTNPAHLLGLSEH